MKLRLGLALVFLAPTTIVQCGPSGASDAAVSDVPAVPQDTNADIVDGGSPGADTGLDVAGDSPVDVAVDSPVDVVVDGPADAGAFTPASLSGLSLWLDGDAIAATTTRVARWPDQSSHHNDALQSTSANQPTLTPAASGLHGHALVNFNGTTSFLTVPDSASLQFDATGFFLEAVVQFASSDAGSSIYSKFGPTAPFAGPYLYLTPLSSTGHPASFGFNLDAATTLPGMVYFNAGVPHRVRVRWTPSAVGATGGTLGVGVDVGPEATLGVATVPDLAQAGVDVTLGHNSNQLSPFLGAIATIIVVKGPTTDAEQQAIDAYVTTRFGL